MLSRKFIVTIQFRNVVPHCEEEKMLYMHESKMLQEHSEIVEIIGYNGSCSLTLYFYLFMVCLTLLGAQAI
jgi:hypothetical protein